MQRPSQNLPNQQFQDYSAGDNAPRRRPPITTSGGYGVADPTGAATLQPMYGGYQYQTVPMSGQRANYPYHQDGTGASRPMDQEYFQTYGQNYQAQSFEPRHQQANADFTHSASRKSPDSHTNQPLENVVENQQSLQMPVNVHPIPPQNTGKQWASHVRSQEQATHASQGPLSGAPHGHSGAHPPTTTLKQDPTSTAVTTGATEGPISAAKIVMKMSGADDQKSGKLITSKLVSGGKKPSTAQSKPWVQFTGPAKKDPILCTWLTVRQVLSGDTFRLAAIKPPKQSLTPPKIMTFTLEGVRAPRIGRGEKRDEPFAYEAREFVRKNLCTGAPVLCVAWTMLKEDSGPHYCGDIYISTKSKDSSDPTSQKESLTHLLVSSGFADLITKDKNFSPVEQERLFKALEKAKKSSLGKFADGDDEKKAPANTGTDNSKKKKGGKQSEHVRELIVARTPEERKKIADKYLNKTINAVVDQVWGGSTLRLELIPDEKNLTHELIPVNLAGCSAPRSQGPVGDDSEKGNKGKGGNANRKNPRWSNEAKEFTEERLLSQRVTVKIVATDSTSNIYAVVSHPKGQIALSLLRAGLAEYDSWTAQLLNNKDQKDMKDALKGAQEKRIHIWQDKTANISHDFVQVTVTQVISGDTFVAQLPGGIEERFSLSSIRQPRIKDNTKGNFNKDKATKDNNTKDNANKDNTNKDNTNKDNTNKDNTNKEKDKTNKDKTNKDKANKEKTNKDKSNKESTKEATSQKPNVEKKGGKGETTQAPSANVEHPWARASKEFLRKKLIGKNVQLMCDYEKEWKQAKSQGDAKVQKYVTILVNKENVAVDLVSAGLAEVISHRSDEPKSAAYLELQRAQEKAKKSKKGMFGKDTPEEVVDYSSGFGDIAPSVMIQLQNFLKNQKRKGVVDYVFNGQRLKVYLPEKNCIIPVGLQFIQCDAYHATIAKFQTKTGADAYKFVKQRLFQRDVEIEVAEIVDQNNRSSLWVGKIWINGKDVALELLEQGLARIFVPPSVLGQRGLRRSNVPNVPSPYSEAELAAKGKKLGRWEEIAAKKQERDEERKKNDLTGQEKTAVVCHVDSAVQFWVNIGASTELENLEAEMSRVPPQSPGKIRPGKIVAALYDGLYCRARVLKQSPQDPRQWLVLFLDYGNRAWIAEKNMAPLQQKVNLGQQPALAHPCQLAALRAPSRGTAYYNISGEKFAELTLSSSQKDKPLVKELKIKIVWDDLENRKWHVVLTDQSTNVNEYLLKNGYARFDQKGKETPKEIFGLEDSFAKEYLKTAQKLNDEALEGRVGLWEVGDATTDEEEDF